MLKPILKVTAGEYITEAEAFVSKMGKVRDDRDTILVHFVNGKASTYFTDDVVDVRLIALAPLEQG
jgi:hypothetical protein